MSIFADALKKIVDENNIVRSRLAETTGIERTTLQHILSGKRAPRKEQVDQIIAALPIPPHEKTRLMQTYEISEYGKDKFQQRSKIKEIVEKVATASAIQLKTPAPVKSGSVNADVIEDEDLYGTSAINSALLRILQEENENVTFFMPSDFSFFYNTLFAQFIAKPSLKIDCMLPLSNSKNNVMLNLEYFEAFIPFFVAPKYDFQAYYVYENIRCPRDNAIIPFPFFVCTDRYVFALSCDMNNAFLTKSEPVLQAYKKMCKTFLKTATPFYMKPSLSELVASYPRYDYTTEYLFIISSQPCFQLCIDEKMGQKYVTLNSEEDAALVQQYNEYLVDLRKDRDFFIAFSQEGLDSFVKTGHIDMLPPHLVKPFDVPDRIQILRRILQGTNNDAFRCRLINTSKFTPPNKATHLVVRGRAMTIEHLDYVTPNLKIAFLTEEFIVDAFTDFFHYLPNTDFVYSKTETVKAFEAALEKLEAM